LYKVTKEDLKNWISAEKLIKLKISHFKALKRLKRGLKGFKDLKSI